MNTEKQTKINQLLASIPSGVVMQSAWLKGHGYSLDLLKHYRKGKWLDSIGTGAMIRSGDTVGYEGAIYALQSQSGLSVHPAGRTALALLGKTHYLELSANYVTVFGGKYEVLPIWFKKHNWDINIKYYQTSFLPNDIGLTEVELKNFPLKVSNAERAVMECLYLAPKEQELMECYEHMVGLNNARPNEVQMLLEKCQSIKVKRLFLYMAEKAGHDWFEFLNLDKIEIGFGKRSIVRNGVYSSKYKITVPKELEEHDKRSI